MPQSRRSMYETLENLSLRLLNVDSRGRHGQGIWIFAVLSALLLGGALVAGPYPITLFPTDAMHALAQGDHLARGNRPYVDYFSLHGPLPFLLIALGIEVHGISLQAVVLGQVLGAALLGLMTLKIALSRLHVFWAVVLGVSVELVLISSTPLGRRCWREFSPAMWYNAVSFCLMAIVFLYLLVPSQSVRKMNTWTDAVLVGVALAATFHTKLSFFAPVLIVFGLGTVLWPRGAGMRAEGIVALGVGAAATVGLAWALGASIGGYLGFLQSVSLRVHPLALALRFIQYTRTIGVFLVSMLLAGWMAHEAGLVRSMRREWLLALLMFGALLATAATCKQDPETLPMLGVVTLGVATATAALASQSGRRVNAKLAAPILLIGLLLVTHEAKNGALSWVFSRMTIKTIEPPVERLADAEYEASKLSMSERVDRSLFALMPRKWVESTFAALSLLEQEGAQAGETIHVASVSNGITMFTDLKYAHGETPWAPFTFADKPTDVPLPVDDFLSDADWILREKASPESWEYLTALRGEYVKQRFRVAAENAHWTLYERN